MRAVDKGMQGLAGSARGSGKVYMTGWRVCSNEWWEAGCGGQNAKSSYCLRNKQNITITFKQQFPVARIGLYNHDSASFDHGKVQLLNKGKAVYSKDWKDLFPKRGQDATKGQYRTLDSPSVMADTLVLSNDKNKPSFVVELEAFTPKSESVKPNCPYLPFIQEGCHHWNDYVLTGDVNWWNFQKGLGLSAGTWANTTLLHAALLRANSNRGGSISVYTDPYGSWVGSITSHSLMMAQRNGGMINTETSKNGPGYDDQWKKGPIVTNKNRPGGYTYKMMKFCKVAKWTSCVSCQRILAGFTSGFDARMTKKCAKGQTPCTVKKVCGVGEYDRQMRWMPTEFAKDLDPRYGASIDQEELRSSNSQGGVQRCVLKAKNAHVDANPASCLDHLLHPCYHIVTTSLGWEHFASFSQDTQIEHCVQCEWLQILH